MLKSHLICTLKNTFKPLHTLSSLCFSVQVYVMGEEGIVEELQLAGFTGLGGPVSR